MYDIISNWYIIHLYLPMMSVGQSTVLWRGIHSMLAN